MFGEHANLPNLVLIDGRRFVSALPPRRTNWRPGQESRALTRLNKRDGKRSRHWKSNHAPAVRCFMLFIFRGSSYSLTAAVNDSFHNGR